MRYDTSPNVRQSCYFILIMYQFRFFVVVVVFIVMRNRHGLRNRKEKKEIERKFN